MTLAKFLKATAGAAGGDKLYVEDVFSTYLYTGNGSTQTITNGIDLAGENGMVWLKGRSDASSHAVYDTVRGAPFALRPNSSGGQVSEATGLTVFNNNGFSFAGGNTEANYSGWTYSSWTFRKAPKFFDVVTYTGNGVTTAIPHNLGSVPGCIIVKNLNSSIDWAVYHRSSAKSGFTAEQSWLRLNLTNAVTDSDVWGNTAPTDTHFYVGPNRAATNQSGINYVAYLFAHDAGGFGDDGLQNVISCGSFTSDGSGNATVNLGFEPQWLMTKSTNTTGNWVMVDVMRGWAQENNQNILNANLTDAESANSANLTNITSTGIKSYLTYLGANNTYIYIAIRRPMKTPTLGTEVYKSIARAGTGTSTTITGVGFAPDASIIQVRNAAWGSRFLDRLRNKMNDIYTTGAEQTITNAISSWNMDGVTVDTDSATNGSGRTFVDHYFKRAPGFFDVVAYTGTGAVQNVAHNLGVAPELMIVKSRSTSGYNWPTYVSSLGGTKFFNLNTNAAPAANPNRWNDTNPTDSVFTVGSGIETNNSGTTYIAYLFASCPGVSKIGSVYVDSSGTLNVDCGFSNGARFVMLKRTSGTSSWYVFDTARGIVAGNDPYLAFDKTNAENFYGANDNIDPYPQGFSIPMNTFSNLEGTGDYIFLAIA